MLLAVCTREPAAFIYDGNVPTRIKPQKRIELTLSEVPENEEGLFDTERVTGGATCLAMPKCAYAWLGMTFWALRFHPVVTSKPYIER